MQYSEKFWNRIQGNYNLLNVLLNLEKNRLNWFFVKFGDDFILIEIKSLFF